MQITNKLFASLVGAALAIPAAPAFAANSYGINAGSTVKIDEHGVCRNVKNTSSVKMNIPTKTASEWSVGGSAFLGAARDNTRLSMCIETKIRTPLGWTMYASGESNSSIDYNIAYNLHASQWPGDFDDFKVNNDVYFNMMDVNGSGGPVDIIRFVQPTREYNYWGQEVVRFDLRNNFHPVHLDTEKNNGDLKDLIPDNEVWRVKKWERYTKPNAAPSTYIGTKNKWILERRKIDNWNGLGHVADQIQARRTNAGVFWKPKYGAVNYTSSMEDGPVDNQGYWIAGNESIWGGVRLTDHGTITHEGSRKGNSSLIHWRDYDGLSDAWTYNVGSCSVRGSQSVPSFAKNNGYKIVDMDICPNLPLTITRNDATAIAHPDDKRIFVDKYTPASSFTGGIRLPGAVFSEEIAYTMSGGNTKRMDYYTWIGTGVYVVVPAGVNVSLS